MIYIEKQHPPKKIADKVAAIKSGSEWRNATDNETDKLRSCFDQLDKSAIKEALCKEQHGLCAYCMRRIHNDNKMTIEHWQPIKKGESDVSWEKDNVLAYRNFLGCCDGGRSTDDSNKILCCDASKSNKCITISPLKKEHTQKLVYRANGRIETKPHDEELDHDINYVLNLNGKLDDNGNFLHDTLTALVRGRRETYEYYSYFVERLEKKFGNNETKIRNGIAKRIDVMESADEYEPFIGVWLYFLRRRLHGVKKKH